MKHTNIRVLLVDDHAVVRAGFKLFLSTVSEITFIAEADCGEKALQLFPEIQPDIIVMDLSMPGIGGLETIQRLVSRYPAIKILVFSVHDEQVYVSRAINAGAKGYMTKSSAPDLLADAIKLILSGEVFIEASLKSHIDGKASDYQQIIEAFSSREFDVFRMLAQGSDAHRISRELCLGYKTVANYSTGIKKKLKVSNVAELSHVAIVLGLLKP